MTFTSGGDRLEQAAGLTAVLDAAYEAFEGMRVEFRAHEDPASGFFAAFVMAAAAAADGRDAVAFAPSLSPRPRRGTAETAPGLSAGERVERIASEAADLSQLLTQCLVRAAGLASARGDQEACEQASGCAREIFDLLGVST